MSHQTEKLREWIRSGKINSEQNRDEWEWAVARVYEEERREESECLCNYSTGDMTVSEFKKYRKKQLQEMRPYVPGEDLTGVSVSPADQKLDSLDGGMIARNPQNHGDLWYVEAKFFQDNYEEA